MLSLLYSLSNVRAIEDVGPILLPDENFILFYFV